MIVGLIRFEPGRQSILRAHFIFSRKAFPAPPRSVRHNRLQRRNGSQPKMLKVLKNKAR
jgi:hypothetical protein